MDEFEHAHAVHLIADGQLAYRDFFEHHPPLLYHAAELLYSIHGAKPGTMFVFRYAMLFCMAACMAGIFLSRNKSNGDIIPGLVSVLAWAYLLLVVEKGIEFRPDPPALACMALAMGLYLRLGGARSLRAVIAGALFWGIAGAFTQKMIFPFLGASLFHFFSCAFDASSDKKTRMIHLILWPLLAALPFFLCMAYYAAQPGAPIPEPFYGPDWIRILSGALPVMLDRVIFWNLNWANRIRVFPIIFDIVQKNWAFWFMAVAGFFLCLSGLKSWGRFFVQTKTKESDSEDRLWPDSARLSALTALGAAVGAVLNPVPYFQYFLCLALPGAILVGHVFAFALHRAKAEPKDKSRRSRLTVPITLVFLLVAPPLIHFPKVVEKRCDNQVEAITFFTTQVDPSWKIMDGWTGFGVFNPSAWYYYFLHLEIRKMLPESVQIEGATKALSEARIVLRDPDLRKLPNEIQKIIDADFSPHNGLIYFRKISLPD